MLMSGPNDKTEVPTILVHDQKGSSILCFLEQLIPIEDKNYGLLTPVDTPVSLFKLQDDGEPELIEAIKSNEKSPV